MKRDTIAPTVTRSPRPSQLRRSKSERARLGDNRKKLLDTLGGSSSRQLTKESGHSKRTAKASGRRRSSSRLEESCRASEGKRRLRSSRTKRDGEIPARSRSFSKKRASASSSTKDLLENLPNEEEGEAKQRDSVTLGSLTKDIQMASSMHYSRRDVSKRRNLHSSLHSSMNGLDAGSSRHGHTRLSSFRRHNSLHGSSRHSASGRRRRRDGSHRRSKEPQHPTDDETWMEEGESIRILQFDCSRSSGVKVVEATNVHSKSKRSSYDLLASLLPEELSVAATEGTASLENSFNSSVLVEHDDQPLMFSTSEDDQNEENEKDEEIKTYKKTKGAFKKVSKLLSTPRAKRRSAVKTNPLMDMSMASLHI